MTNTQNPARPHGTQQRPHTALLGAALAARLGEVLASGSGEPVVTYLDHGSGERTELSAATTANWATKFANLLQYEVGDAMDATDVTGVGARFAGDTVTHAEGGTGRPEHRGVLGVVELATDGHWAAVPTVLGSWRLGIAVRPHDAVEPAPDDALAADLRVAFETLAAPGDLVVGPELGGRLSPEVDVERVYVDEVLTEADELDADDPAVSSVAVVQDGDGTTDLSGIAGGFGPLEGRRILLLDPVDSWPGLVALAAIVASGGALVLVRDADHTRLGELVQAERITLVAGSRAALERLAAPDLPEVETLTLPG